MDIYSSVERDNSGASKYGHKSGTSMAAPYVTGIAALYASMNQTLKGARLKTHVIANALSVPGLSGSGLARFH